jgi:hypothetical protein
MNSAPYLARFAALAIVLPLAACAAPQGRREVFEPSRHNIETQLLAAETELRGKDPEDAAEALAPLAGAPLDDLQRIRYQLLQAELALAEARPLAALQALPPAGEIRDPELALRAEADRAQALFLMGDAVAATQVLVLRERLTADPALRADNRELLWSNLRTTDLDTAVGPRLAHADKITRGWVELAVLSRSVWLNARDLQAQLEQWRVQHPGHPAEDRAAGISLAQAGGTRKVLQSVALLLPLSGSFAATAEAIRDGFFAAFFRAEVPRPTVRVYDTGATLDSLLAAYREALDEGAEFIVGPLKREDVATLAESGRQPVPVLALNYLDANRRAPFNFFQWGLAPEDEARQAAERAVTEHQYRAVALVPDSEWGSRVLAAFRGRLESLGGRVVEARTYSSDSRDHSEAIRALLVLDKSEERHRALTSTLGVKSEFEPRRRNDVDLVFIAARADHAQLLGPQLRFHRAGDLPIYATSLIYDGEAPAADLNGLRFCDMPWMLAQAGPGDTGQSWAALRSQLRTLFPGRSRDYTRLLALGYDAYTLVVLIESGQLSPGTFYPAGSGTLSLREDGVITRGLACAEIKNGAVKPLDVAPIP